MLNNLSAQIRECLRHADDCARQAAAQNCPKLKEDFLDMERRWLLLARSYEFTEQLADFSGGPATEAPLFAVVRRIVPITPFLKGQAFDPEVVEAMGAAFAKTCDALDLTKRTDPITALVAEKIIELAQRGLRNPTAMHLMAMKELKSSSH